MSGVMTIDGRKIPFTNEKNVLSVIKNAGIDLPTFCYHSELSIDGACRMCVVENARGEIFASCSEPPKDGMVIYTNTKRIQKYRKTILELLLANHDRDCTTCERTGQCKLQALATRYGIKDIRFGTGPDVHKIDHSSPSIYRNPNKCIKCGDCVLVCEDVQGVGALGFVGRGFKVEIGPAFKRMLSNTNCVSCGQCRVVCPTGAIAIKDETQLAWDAIFDPKKRVVAQVAPAVRVALGEEFGLAPGAVTLGKIVACLRRIGVEEVYDTGIGADLTVIEESNEFAEKLTKNGALPLFTSCCPAWVKFLENKYPEMMSHVSSCKSPQQMFGTVLKETYRELDDEDGRETFMISVMPCTAKKMEASRPEFCDDGKREVDVVITTQELAMMIKQMGIDFDTLEEEAMDIPFGIASGAGIIFGATGGVTEAVLRRLLKGKMGKDDLEMAYKSVRGMKGIKEASLTVDGREVHIAVVSGLKNAEYILRQMKSGEKHYDLVEVMACKGGCIAGGGQPVPRILSAETREKRAKGLYGIDRTKQIKRSDENYMMLSLYEGVLKGKEHILHVHRHSEE